MQKMNIEKYFVDNNIIWKFITLLSFPIWNYRIIFCMDQVEKFFLYKTNKTNKFKKLTKIKVICSYIHSIYTHVFGDQLKNEYTKIIAALPYCIRMYCGVFKGIIVTRFFPVCIMILSHLYHLLTY